MITEGTTSKVCNDDQWRGRRKKKGERDRNFLRCKLGQSERSWVFFPFFFFPFFFARGKERERDEGRTKERQNEGAERRVVTR